MVDISEDIKSIYGGVNTKDTTGVQNRSISDHVGIDLARKQIHMLMASDELRHIHTLAIVLNCRNSCPLYDQIFSKDKRTSIYIKKLSDYGLYDNKEPDDLPDELEADPTHQLAAENKRQMELATRSSKKTNRSTMKQLK